MFSNRVEIELNSILGPLVLHDDPINYDQSETEIGRSEKTFGIFLKETNNLQFVGKAKKWLDTLFALSGINAKCQLIRRERHPTTDEWRLKAVGSLDFSTRNIKEGKLHINFVEGGLREILVSQLREKYELNRTTDIKGKAISKLKTDVLSLMGKELYLLSRLSTTENFIVKSGIWSPNSYEYRESFRPFPLHIDANSDPLNIQTPFETLGMNDHWTGPRLPNMFFATSDRNRGRIIFNANVYFKLESVIAINARNLSFSVVLDRYDVDLVRIDRKIIATYNPEDVEGQSFTLPTYEYILDGLNDVKEGESFAFGIFNSGEYTGNLTSEGFMELEFSEVKIDVSWAEDSFYERTSAPCLTAFEVGKRQTEIYTGKECFESKLLDGSDTTFLKDANHQLLFTTGGWLRNLKKKVDVLDEFGNVTRSVLEEWPMEISFEDFYKSINAILPVGYGIATSGNFQKIVFEDLRFFFQRTVVGSLGKIEIKGRDTAIEYCYGPLKFGYVKGGEYEKPLGLDEYNTQADSRSPLIKEGLTTYDVLGPSRTDGHAIEDARRMQFKDHPDEDTTYDKDNFLIDSKFLTRSNFANYYEPRIYSDDFESVPTGIYSPKTAINLNLSPAQNRKRHEYWWSSAITMLRDEEVQFLNAKGNSELRTKKPGEDPVKERDNVPVAKLQKPIFKPEWIEAESSFNQKIMDKILDSTMIEGRMINNYYGLWEFINEKNKTEYAFIFTVKSKDKLTYKLLSAYIGS